MATSHKSIRIAFIGLGSRGLKTLSLMLPLEGIKVAALCDLAHANVEDAWQLVADRDVLVCEGREAYKEVCRSEGIDLVYICSDWTSHTPIAVEAMRAGKHVAVEVPAALTLADIRLLQDTARQTGRLCFMLENVCFEQQVLEAIAAIRRGEIGEVVHAEGCYYHHLDDRWSPWRLDINRRQRGDLYPTHELGPICQALDIGRTDRLETLICMDSVPLSGPRVYESAMGTTAADFQNGDHTTTLIRTARGHTILLKHDVITRQPYERQLTFIGTEGRITLNDMGRASHEAMTTAMNRHLIDCLRLGHTPAISAADMATWCAAIPLSQESIARGFAPVAFPDFYV